MMQLIVVTGLSGSGKSVVLKVLEDAGYYCVDNLPATLLPQIAKELISVSQERLAVSVDTRSTALEVLPDNIKLLQSQGVSVSLLFLDANHETLVKRFSETRRKHPLSSGDNTLSEAIERERQLLSQLAELGHHIDTSNLSANNLRAWVKDFFAQKAVGLTLLFTSFGYKHGVPLDADFVFDVRFLPNPHYDVALRPLTGLDEPVINFLEQQASVSPILQDITSFIQKWLPEFVRDNRNYLTIAIGCTGGQHRSVYIVESLGTRFKAMHQNVLIRHRELEQA